MTAPGRLEAPGREEPWPRPHIMTARVDGAPLSARVCTAPSPRGVVLALHGGGMHAGYFDCPGRPELSLLRTGAALGWTVIALDRPGYGASAPYADRYHDPGHRVEVTHAALEGLLAGLPRGAGLFVVAHSAGCELAVRTAALGTLGTALLGLELAGTGLRFDDRTGQVLARNEKARRTGGVPPAGLRETLWGPPALYPEDVWNAPHVVGDSPLYEAVTQYWVREDFPELAPRVRVPVRFTLGDHESVWESGPSALAEVAGLFTAAPRVSTHEQASSGHNISLGLAARAYHLRVLAFAEECVVRREQERHGAEGAMP